MPGRGSARRRDLTWADKTGNVTPDPWEAVEMRPAMVWSEMEPMLGIASGGSEAAREAWTSWMVVPARNVAVCFSLSIYVIGR